MFKTTDGTAFDVHGPVDGPPVVLIHGLGLCRALWDDHLAAYTEKYRVITYDLFGHGVSAAAPETPSLTVFSDQLSRLLNELGVGPAVIVGFSIGGMINRRFAMDHGDQASCLVIMNSPHNRGEDLQMQVEARAKTVRDQGAMSTMDSALKRWFTPEFRSIIDGGPYLVKKWRNMVDPESYAGAAWVLANGVRELIQPDPPVMHTSLVITCENDSGSTPKMSHDIASEIEGAETLIVPYLQHLGLMEDPDAFTTPILDFLERTL